MHSIARLVKMGTMGLCGLVVFAATVNIPTPTSAAAATASATEAATAAASSADTSSEVCTVVPDEALNTIAKACSLASANSVCYGSASSVTAPDSLTFAAQGDQVDVTKVTAVTTTADAPSSASAASSSAGSAVKWGIAMLRLQSDLPASSQGLTAVLFGSATMTSKVHVSGGDLPTLSAQTVDVDPVLLRTGASPNYPAAARLLSGKIGLADGRSQDSTWVRVRLNGAVGWARVEQLKIDGDIQTLTVLDKEDIDTSFLYKAPMQAFELTTGKAADTCGAAPSGLLLNLTDRATTHLLINGVDVALQGPATALLRATPRDRFEILALQGTTTIAAQGASLDLNAGDWTRLRIGGKDGLTLTQPPSSKSTFSFSAVMGAPIALLAQPVACMVGLTAKDKSVAIHGGPDATWWVLSYMKPDALYKVVGYADDTNGARWWKLDASSGTQAWVAVSSVNSVGNCATVAKADAPGAVAASAPSGGGSSGSGSSTTPAGPSYAPTGRTIWSASLSGDRMVGQCSGGPINYCDQMIALTPNGPGFLWKGQALKQFTMFPGKQPNVYSYAGPNGTGDGTVTMVMVFTSPSTMTMTETLVMNSEPTCKHIHTFTATFLR
ncbi:MAG TPA: hypothetical protein VMT34_01710 [Aggregatilineales bacterium]|nr:hypothetical protein [Aggregatilineales bacterium]